MNFSWHLNVCSRTARTDTSTQDSTCMLRRSTNTHRETDTHARTHTSTFSLEGQLSALVFTLLSLHTGSIQRLKARSRQARACCMCVCAYVLEIDSVWLMLKPSDQTVHWILASSIIPRLAGYAQCVFAWASVRAHVWPTLRFRMCQPILSMRFKGHVKEMSFADAPHLSHKRVTEEKWMQPLWAVCVCTLKSNFPQQGKDPENPTTLSLQLLRAEGLMIMSRAAQICNNTRTENHAHGLIARHKSKIYKHCQRRPKETHKAHRRPHKQWKQ